MKLIWNIFIMIAGVIAQLVWFGTLFEMGIGWLVLSLIFWPASLWPILLAASLVISDTEGTER